MTEAEWVSCADPAPMLEFLRGRASDRHLRLFLAGCCRRVRHLLPDDRLPILADALEDAGCGDADILAHCRGPGPHARGCPVIDRLLGRA